MTFGVVVPWRDTGCEHRRAAWKQVRRQWTDPVIASGPPGLFNIAAALNRGIAQSTADVLLLTGADVLVDPTAVAEAVSVARGGRWVMVADVYNRSDGQMFTGLGWGPIVAPRAMLADVGYEERCTGWGAEDDIFGITADTLHGPPVRIGAAVDLLWHPSTGPDHPGYPSNVALLDRYRAAHGNVSAVRDLIAERPTHRCEFVHAGVRCLFRDGHPDAHEMCRVMEAS